MNKLFQVACTLSAEGRGNYTVPGFAVYAKDASEAIGIANLIVMCDRRTRDGILWTLAGTVSILGETVTTFRIEMKEN